jgi:hypothetical protein
MSWITIVGCQEVGHWHRFGHHHRHGHLLGRLVSQLILVRHSFRDRHTSVTTAAPASAAVATTTATTVTDHLLQARVNLLLSLLQNVHQVTSLLGV